jgi:hypothetical protein
MREKGEEGRKGKGEEEVKEVFAHHGTIRVPLTILGCYCCFVGENAS